MIQFIILGILIQMPCSGYDLKKRIEEGIGLFYKASYGSLYPLLRRLEEQGMIKHHEIEGQRKKKEYEILPEGRKCFYQWLREPYQQGTGEEAFMAHVYFYDLLSKEEAEAGIYEYMEHLKKYKEELLCLRKKYKEYEENNENYYVMSTLFFGIAKLENLIKWCEITSKRTPLCMLLEGEKECRK